MSPNRPEQLNSTTQSRKTIIAKIPSQEAVGNINLIQAQSLAALPDIGDDHPMHTYASQAITPIAGSGPHENPSHAHISPSKRGAMALEGSPMFAPLEVKYKNLSKF